MNNEHTTLLKCKTDLTHLRTVCKPGFETKFYNENVITIIENISRYLESNTEAHQLLTATENLIKKINRFGQVSGIVKITLKIVEEAKTTIESRIDPEALIIRDLILHIGPCLRKAICRRNPRDEAFFRRAQTALDNIRQEYPYVQSQTIERFIKETEKLKTTSYERTITIGLFKKFLEIP